MLTGVETAGLALAIFPLVVKGISTLHESAHKVKNFIKYKNILGRLMNELEMERSKFFNTCEHILGDMATPERLDGAGWDNNDFQHQLEERLSQQTAALFVMIMSSLGSNLRELSAALELDKCHKPTLLSGDAKLRQWKKVKLILKEGDHDVSLHRIYKANADLDRLILRQVHSTPVMRSSRPNSATKTHIRIRNHAIKLYEVFCKDFNAGPPTCQCAAPHNVDLPLQRVSVGKEDHPEGSVKFTVLFSFEKWHEIDFESVDCQEEAHETAPNSSSLSDDESETDSNSRSTFSTLFSKFRGKSQTPPTILEAMERTCGDTTLYALAVSGSVNQNIRSKRAESRSVKFETKRPPRTFHNAQRIESLCRTIQQSGCGSSDDCMGILIAEENKWWHRLYPPTDPLSVSYISETISLEKLFQRGALDKADRLKLGVQLASAMMQLHSSGWMGESWGKRDIFFPQVVTVAETMAGNLTSTRKPIIGNPFVHQSFGMVGSSGGIAGNEPTPVKSPLLRYDGCLLSLGIILVELWFGTCLENLPEYLQMRDNSSYQISDNAEFHTADQLIERIEEEAGTMYGGAVRRCIRGLDHSATSLTHEGFKNEVQVKVIAELERNWKIYARRN